MVLARTPNAITKRKKRELIGLFAWQSQYQNDPSLEEGASFKPTWLDKCFYEEEQDHSSLRIIQCCDLAISKKETADYFVITTLGVTPDMSCYVLDYERAHLDFAEQVKAIVTHIQTWNPERVYVEQVAYQKALVQHLKGFPQVTGVDQTRDKILRINALAPFWEKGTIKIQKSMRELIIEYRQFPKGAHDDLLDSIEIGVRMSMNEDRSLPMSMAVD